MSNQTVFSSQTSGGIPYTRVGDGAQCVVVLDNFRLENRIAEGLVLQGLARAWEELGEHFEIYVIERRPEMAIDFDLEDMASDAAAAVEELCDAPAALLGIGMGGMVSLRLAARRPELVSALVLARSAYRLNPAMTPRLKRWSEDAEKLEWRRVHRDMVSAMFSDTFLAKTLGAVAWLFPELMGVPDYPWDFIVALRAVLGEDLSEDLSRITARTLVLSAGRDILFTPEDGKETAARINGARHNVLPYAGHGTTRKSREVEHRNVREFLESSG